VILDSKPAEPLSILRAPTNAADYKTICKMFQRESQLGTHFAAAGMKFACNKSHRYQEHNVGDELSLKLHKGSHLPDKAKKQRIGPLIIVGHVGDLAYELAFPRHWKVRRVLSIAQVS
jgi:hypothetical protein